MFNSKFLLSGISLAVASIAVIAKPVTPVVDQRQAHQEKRINRGVASGDLTARETYHLGKQQAHVAAAENSAKADGKVSNKERRRLHHLQDRTSKNIHHQKHDAQTPA
jgi:uncharacterized membrane protein YebE (DUF533 family)